MKSGSLQWLGAFFVALALPLRSASPMSFHAFTVMRNNVYNRFN